MPTEKLKVKEIVSTLRSIRDGEWTPPKGARTFDTQTQGLGVHWHRRKGTIFVVGRLAGTTRQKYLSLEDLPLDGSQTAVRDALDRARPKAEEARRKLADGIDPAQERAEQISDNRTDAERTMRALFEEWKAAGFPSGKKSGELPGARTRRDYESKWRVHIEPAVGDRRVSAITTATLERDLMRELRANRSRTNNYVRAVLRLLFQYAELLEWKPRNSNPAEHLATRKETSRGDPALTAEQLRTCGEIVAQAWRDGGTRRSQAILISLVVATGRRAHEIQELRWDQISEDWLHTLEGRDDTGKEVWRYLGKGGARILLQAWKERRSDKDPFVCFGRKVGSQLAYYRTLWDECRQAMGRPDLRVHDLRHAYGTAALSETGNLRVVQVLLGHKRMATTERYGHVLQREGEQWSDRLSEQRLDALALEFDRDAEAEDAEVVADETDPNPQTA